MKVILNTESLRSPLTGIGHYTFQLLQGLREHAMINEIIGMPTAIQAFDANILLEIKTASPLLKFARSIPFAYPLMRHFRQSRLPVLSGYLKHPCVYHETNYILNRYEGPKVCTVHDLSHIHYPQYHPRERVKFLMNTLPRSIEQADHIIAVSSHARDEIIKQFNLPSTKITTVYHGVDTAFKPRPVTEISSVLATYGLQNQEYLLSVGTIEPRKNLMHLIHAYQRLPEGLRKRYPLVLVGARGWRTSSLDRVMRFLIHKQQLYCLGYVPGTDLPFLYAGARAFAYVSLYEGFGLPLLEALACGTPTLSSDVTSMPEVVQDAGLLVNPMDVSAMTSQLEILLTDGSKRIELHKKGIFQAKKFTWQKCVDDTIAVYNRVIGH